MKTNTRLFFTLGLFFLLSGALVFAQPQKEQRPPATQGGKALTGQTDITITAGDSILYGVLYDNPQAREFADRLPVTGALWEPADFAKAFNLTSRLAGDPERTWQFEAGVMAYWNEGPSIAFFHTKNRDKTVVPVVHLGKLHAGVELFRDYTGNITIERQ